MMKITADRIAQIEARRDEAIQILPLKGRWQARQRLAEGQLSAPLPLTSRVPVCIF